MEPQPGPSTKKDLSPQKKRPRSHLSPNEKLMVINAYKYLYKTWPHDEYWSLTDCAKKTALALGISVVTVHRIVKENKTTNEFKPPRKPGPTKNILDKLDEFTYSAIRRKVHEFFYRNEAPTLKKIVAAVNADTDLPDFSTYTMRLVLKRLKFKYVTRTRRSCLIDRQDIILWRKRYLMKIKDYRRECRPIYYQDETWINEGHAPNKTWVDERIETPRQAFLEGLTTGLKAPTGKGKRLIISHIGSDEGFVEGGLLIFESKKNTDDYHQEMNATHFEEWLRGILPKLKPNSVLVLDNAPYHSRKVEKTPTTAWRKARIIEWLKEKNINCEESMIKTELLEIVKRNRSRYDNLAVDELAAQQGVTILRLPPYHCELNPIELVWAQVKGHVARNNKTYKMHEVKSLFEEGLKLVTPQRWSDCVGHVIKVEDKMCQLDHLIDNVTETLIINVTEEDSTSSSESESGSE